MSPGTEERLLLEAVTKQCSDDRDWEHYCVCDSDLGGVVMSCVLKYPINPITNPVCSHLSRDNILYAHPIFASSYMYN
jgi:hypothetical protein